MQNKTFEGNSYFCPALLLGILVSNQWYWKKSTPWRWNAVYDSYASPIETTSIIMSGKRLYWPTWRPHLNHKIRKLQWFGYVTRSQSLANTITHGAQKGPENQNDLKMAPKTKDWTNPNLTSTTLDVCHREQRRVRTKLSNKVAPQQSFVGVPRDRWEVSEVTLLLLLLSPPPPSLFFLFFFTMILCRGGIVRFRF